MTEQKTFEEEWERAERNRGARFFILANWRVPESEMRALLELQDEIGLAAGHRARRPRTLKDGRIWTKGIQMRLTAVIRAIESFGPECYAAVETIAGRFGASKRTAQRALADAQLLGLVLITPRPNNTSTYAINWKRLFDWTQNLPVSDPPGVTTCHPRGDNVARRGDNVARRGDNVARRGDNVSPETTLKHNAKHKLNNMPVFQIFASEEMPASSGGWSKPISRQMLADREQLEQLFNEAALRGFIERDHPRSKLRFFSLAAYCVRKSRPGGKIEDAGALFTSGLRGQHWDWPANEDEDMARAMLRADELPRTEADDSPRVVDREEQLARLRARFTGGAAP